MGDWRRREFLSFGDALKSLNDSTDDVEPTGIFSISLGY